MIVPVGEEPPLRIALSRIAPVRVAVADPSVDSANAPDSKPAVEVGGPTAVTVAAGAGGAGEAAGRTGATVGSGQFVITRLVDCEFEVSSRVSPDDHADDAVTAPLPLGIATVSDDELPANDAVPCTVAVEPTAGLNTTVQLGVLRPSLPLPDEAKFAQVKVTDLQAATALTVCACGPMHITACALAAKIASTPIESGMTFRDRRAIMPQPTRNALGMSRPAFIAGTPHVRSFWMRCFAKLREARSDEVCVARGPPTSASAEWFSDASIWRSRPIRGHGRRRLVASQPVGAHPPRCRAKCQDRYTTSIPRCVPGPINCRPAPDYLTGRTLPVDASGPVTAGPNDDIC